ncbi:MAG: hypothetical protein JST54_09160 [Deltaproteobacteria bacterium]|nr:hypothetical protein [Deltaproteobacteria bacterium]
MSQTLRQISRILLVMLCVALAGAAWAKKKKEKPLKVMPGGASQTWACQQLAEAGCDLAKRCEPDKSLRHCRHLKERCAKVKERGSRSATEDDVTVCANTVSDLLCKQVSFDNTSGVEFDIKKLDTCNAVAKDNPLPPAEGATKSEGDDDDKDTKDKAPAEKKPAGGDDDDE